MKKTILLCLALLFCLITASCNNKAKPDTGDFICTFDDINMTAKIDGFTNTSINEVAVPEKFGEYTVTAIGKNAFSEKYEIKKITLPSTLKSIESSAFSLCIGLGDVVLPEGLEEIGNTAFSECRSLKEAIIPENVKKIGICAFKGCKNLKKITVEKDNPRYFNDEFGVLFDREQRTLLQFPIGSSTKTYTVPNDTDVIGDYAFADTLKLENTAFSDGIKKISSYAFYKSAIKEAFLPDSVTDIGSFAFSESGIENAELGSSLRVIGDSAFNFCLSLKSIYIPSNVEKIGSAAFYTCADLESINVDKENPCYFSDENGVLFDKNKTELIQYPSHAVLTEYSIPDGVTKIHISAFSGATLLENVTIPASVSYIGDNAFSECPKLSSALFLGHPPEKTGNEIFRNASDSFVILYKSDAQNNGISN